MTRRGAERIVALAFLVTILSALGLAVVYVRGGQPQLEGALLALSLGGVGVGLIEWARRLLPSQKVVGPREPLRSTEAERRGAEESLERGEEVIGRRPLLVRLLVGAGAALGLAALFPVRSLGPNPGRALFETQWKAGLRLVDSEGRPVKATDLSVGGVVTVFPEGHLDADDSQVLLINVGPGGVRARPGRERWAPGGLVAYSKICTHAGCPVGLYRAERHQLLCPCHQSTFDVLDSAKPVFGPAARPLPQLPIAVTGSGDVVAQSDFTEPVGPAFWNRP